MSPAERAAALNAILEGLEAASVGAQPAPGILHGYARTALEALIGAGFEITATASAAPASPAGIREGRRGTSGSTSSGGGALPEQDTDA